MTQDVRQWLAEIRNLQQKLAEVRQERDEAYAGAANWRKLYETEAQQRRTDTNLARQTIESLKAEIQTVHSGSHVKIALSTQLSELLQQLDHLNVAELKQKLAETLIERDRLSEALQVEQAEHNQTRKGLTTALGDTVDLLTKERASRNGSSLESVPVAIHANGSNSD